jgi:hypothetical protein
MNKADRISHRVNIVSAGVIGVTLSLSLPLFINPDVYSPSPSNAVPPSIESALPLSPSLPPALRVDPDNNTRIVYPDVLTPCDHEDGTATTNGVPVAACIWDATVRGNKAGHTFIVITE